MQRLTAADAATVKPTDRLRRSGPTETDCRLNIAGLRSSLYQSAGGRSCWREDASTIKRSATASAADGDSGFRDTDRDLAAEPYA